MDVYTDGAAISNPAGPAAWAWWVDDTLFAYGTSPKASNQRAELYAIYQALISLPMDEDLVIHTDSSYAVNTLTQWWVKWRAYGWRKKNGSEVYHLDLIQQILYWTWSRSGKTELQWVKAHAGNPGNVKADSLAEEALNNLGHLRRIQKDSPNTEYREGPILSIPGKDTQDAPTQNPVGPRKRRSKRPEDYTGKCVHPTKKGKPCQAQPTRLVNGEWLCHVHDPTGNYQKNKRKGRRRK